MKSVATRAVVNRSSTCARASAPIRARVAASVVTIVAMAAAIDAAVTSPISQPCCPATSTPSVFAAAGDQNRDVAGERLERGDRRRLGLRRHQHDVRGRVQ